MGLGDGNNSNSGYTDFICFTDDENQQRQLFVKILSIDSTFVKFELKSGKVWTVNASRVIKIKQEGNNNG